MSEFETLVDNFVVQVFLSEYGPLKSYVFGFGMVEDHSCNACQAIDTTYRADLEGAHH